MRGFRRLIYSIVGAMNRAGHCALVAVLLVIVINVLGRQVKMPISGSMDMASMLALILMSFAVADCAVDKGHLSVTILVEHLPKGFQRGLGVITYLISAVLFGILAWAFFQWGAEVWQSNKELDVIRVPVFPFIYVQGFGCLLLALVFLVDVLELLFPEAQA